MPDRVVHAPKDGTSTRNATLWATNHEDLAKYPESVGFLSGVDQWPDFSLADDKMHKLGACSQPRQRHLPEAFLSVNITAELLHVRYL